MQDILNNYTVNFYVSYVIKQYNNCNDFELNKVIEGLCERTEHLDIFLFSTHHSMVFYFRCSV